MMRTCALAVAIALAPAAAPAAEPVPAGLWRMASGKAEIRIVDCGGAPCATLASLRKPNGEDGRPKRDRRNPDPALRDRPVVGVALLSGMAPDGEGWSGAFYNPDDGRTYRGRIVVDGPDRLRLRGCFAKVLCRTETLARVR